MLALFDIQPNNVDSDVRNAWYTPAKYIEAARRVMGSIDLDPASCELANKTVKAERYFSKEDNGLAQEWLANNVWLNPPYGVTHNKSNTRIFVERLVSEYEGGNIKQSVVLTLSNTQASWFALLWDYIICFPGEEISFFNPYYPDLRSRYRYSFAITYLGPNEAAFVEEFQQFGTIAKRVSTPKQKPVSLSLWKGGA